MARVATLLALVLFVVAPAIAAIYGMVLTRDDFSNGAPGTQIERDAPRYCYHEDSSHTRTWDGTLGAGQSFTVPLRFCTTAEWPYGPSGTGFYYRVLFWDGHQSISLKVVFPDGSVKLAHNTYAGAWEGCVVPPIRTDPYRETGVFLDFIASGTYQVVLTNTGTKAISAQRPLSEMIWVRMADVWFQSGVCPDVDRRIEESA